MARRNGSGKHPAWVTSAVIVAVIGLAGTFVTTTGSFLNRWLEQKVLAASVQPNPAVSATSPDKVAENLALFIKQTRTIEMLFDRHKYYNHLKSLEELELSGVRAIALSNKDAFDVVRAQINREVDAFNSGKVLD